MRPPVKKTYKQDALPFDLPINSKTERKTSNPGLHSSSKPSCPPSLNHALHKGPGAKAIRKAARGASWPLQQSQLRRAPHRLYVFVSYKRRRGLLPTAYPDTLKLLTKTKVSNTLPQPRLQLQIRVHVDTPYDSPTDMNRRGWDQGAGVGWGSMVRYQGLRT